MEQIVNQPPPMQSAGVRYAGFWRRVVAYIIDELILGVFSFILLIPFIAMIGLSAFSNHEFEPESSAGLVFAMVSAYAFAICLIILGKWLYYALMESKKGATLGKMAMGIRVTDMQGNQISFARATGRYFGKILSGLILGIGYLMAGWTQQKQALHDILAGCLVVLKQ
ncbi:MAG TPA: RDD family protein [Bacteroidota bacterium]|nr:RDD family protein [Bacteroidota bacterium]